MGKRLITTCLFVFTLIAKTFADVDLSCVDDGSITISDLPASYEGSYVMITLDDGTECEGDAAISGNKVTISSCTHELGDDLTAKFSTDEDFKWIDDKSQSVKCDADTEATQNGNIVVKGGTQAPKTDVVEANLKPLDISPSGTLTVGTDVDMKVELTLASQSYYLFTVVHIIIKKDESNERTIVSNGCSDDRNVVLSFDGTGGYGGTYVTVSFKAFLLKVDESTTVEQTYQVEVKVTICGKDDSNCIITPATCPSGSTHSGRKRRQADNGTELTVKGTMRVFPTEESRQNFLDSMRSELGLTEATKMASLDDICVPKTTSVVVIVFLIAGMILCVLATIWMFAKMRKSRRLPHSDKSEFSYPNSHSNKSFKR